MPFTRQYSVASLLACAAAGVAAAVNPAGAASAVQTRWGAVAEPVLPATLCATLSATLVLEHGSVDALDTDPARSGPDTARIQHAIDACPSGAAVKLVAGAGGASGFLSGPLRLKSGVTLWVDRGVTLFASRNPADYDNGPGLCGTAIKKNLRSCNPFILAEHTSDSGIVGDGVIDARGGSLLTSGPNAGKRSWWDVAYQNKSAGLSQQNPRLLQVNFGQRFTLYRISLENSPNFHVVTEQVEGVTAWGIKILSPSLVYTRMGYACPAHSTPDQVTPATCFTPGTVKNTDGFDPADSSKVLLAHAFISVGDDDVAIKAGHGPGTDGLHFAQNHFYYGHGMSLGSETNAGAHDIVVEDLAIDGHDDSNSVGLRIKTDSTRGGAIRTVHYNRVCMRNVRFPLVFDAYYSAHPGKLYPSYADIVIKDLHALGSAAYGGGVVTFAGYMDAARTNAIDITLDNVVFDGVQPAFARGRNGAPAQTPAATHFTLGPGPVSFAGALAPSAETGVTVSGKPGAGTPLDCSSAFVPMQSVMPEAPI